jgi:beta-galactosidase
VVENKQLINLGSTARFTDSDGQIWETDQSYRPKSFGFIGGKAGKVSKNITNTPDDPLYQTFRQGFSGYRFDIPDGDYEIELRFIEPVAGKFGERVFNFYANGAKLAENVDLFQETVLLNSVIKKFKIKVTGNNGLSLDFQAIKGETVLSAVLLQKSSGLNKAK